MHIDILTLFPDIIHGYANEAILGRAQKNGLIEVAAHNFRSFSGNKWGHVDDTPYGGGPGMILRVEPIYECLKSIKALSFRATSRNPSKSSKAISPLAASLGRNDKTKVIVMDPAGKKFDQRMAEKFSELDRLVMICGRYEGFDARVYDFVDERVSVGDFVLAGGELAALSIIEATARLIPGVLGNAESLREETFGRKVSRIEYLVSRNSKTKIPVTKYQILNTKEYPQYTKPENFMGKKVPKVLLSGNHEEIEKWRRLRSW